MIKCLSFSYRDVSVTRYVRGLGHIYDYNYERHFRPNPSLTFVQ